MKNAGPAGVKHADIIVFNGGADIGTKIYNELPLYGGIPREPSQRDHMEVGIFNKFKDDRSKLFVGICRGAQLLNCLNGGTLWQNVNNHGHDHMMRDVITGEKVRVTSTHHQMMRPNLRTGTIIGIADESTRKDAEHDHFPSGSFFDDHKDTEIVWYPGTRSLCIQGHPEYVPGSIFADYCINLIHKYAEESRICVA